MFKRLLILARDFNQAQHWSKEQKMSPGQWVYVSSFHNISGNPESEYVLLKNWEARPDSSILKQELINFKCVERIQNV